MSNENSNQNNQHGNVDWIDESDHENNVREDRNSDLDSPCEHDDERNRAQNAGRQVVNVTAYIGYVGIGGFPHIQAAYSFTGYGEGPGLVQGGLPVRLNGSNTHDYGRPRVNNEGDGGNQDDNGGYHAGVRFGEIYGPPGINEHNNRNDDGCIFYYTTTTAYAHLRRDGEGLSAMLSLRDSHIFNVINATDYVAPINQICNNIDLAQAMVYHIDCVKALLTRNMGLALTKQISCVNAVMALLNEPCNRQEDWTYHVIETVVYDLRVINQKATLQQVAVEESW